MRPSAQVVAARTVGIGLRLAILFLVLLLFVPAANPARIVDKVNRNISLFTSGLFYGSLTSNMGRLLDKGWIHPGTMRLVFLSSLAACLGIFACGAGGCMSMGNARLRRTGQVFSAIGSAAAMAAMLGIWRAHADLLTYLVPEYGTPLQPAGINVVLGLAALVLALSVLDRVVSPSPAKGQKPLLEAKQQLFLLFLPFLLLVFVFSYLPLWGWRYALFNYTPGEPLTLDRFAGLKWITYLFQNEATVRDMVRVIRNTLAMSGLGIVTSWVPMAFAIFLAEIRNTRFRRIVQTLTTVPNFISWVLVYAVAYCIFSTDGFLSSLMVTWGVWPSGQNLLMGDQHIWLKMLAWGMWKGLGWSAIMYIAAITAIDPQLYEAAVVDGAGRFRKMWHITVPQIVPTFIVLLLLSVAGLLSNGLEQYLVFSNATNTDPITVLDLYVYNLGIGLGKGLIPLATLVGTMKSLVSVALLFGANAVARLVRGTSVV